MYTASTEPINLGAYIRYGILAIFVLIFCGYLLWQGRFLLLGPNVTFSQVPALVQESRTVTLQGTAANIVRITLNGREISTTPDGYFAEEIVLENGYTISTITAYDRYGRKRSYTQEFVYTPAFSDRDSSAPGATEQL